MAREFWSWCFKNVPEGREEMDAWMTEQSAEGWEPVAISTTPAVIHGSDPATGHITVTLGRELPS
ncbi:MAG: hypothetical protein JOZ54_04400 [Acidobacteria bacterium]|nr:hypothetical protein [Acidobacteriota bacterium]